MEKARRHRELGLSKKASSKPARRWKPKRLGTTNENAAE